jgi:subfamily B ATP-binding cassette protein MsbA
MHQLLKKLVTINRFLKNFTISRKLLIAILLLIIVSAVGEAFSAGLLIPFLNSLQNAESITGGGGKIIQGISHLFSAVSKEHRFVYVLLSILLLMSFVQLLIIFTNRLNLRFSMFLVENKVANNLFKKILDARLKFFYRVSSGSLINNITTDVRRSHSCIYYLLQMSCALLFALAYVSIGLLILPTYTLGLLLVIGILLFLFRKISPYISSLGQKNRESQEDANNIIVETIQGVRSIILSSAQKTHQHKFKDAIYKFYNSIFNFSWITISFPVFVRLLSLLLIALVLFLNKNKILQENPEYFSLVIFFIYVAGNIFLQLGKINSVYASFAFNYEGLAALLQLDADLKTFKSQKPSGDKKLDGFEKSVEVRNLSFGYNPQDKILDKLTFRILKDQKVAFVGGSGSGKSTLVDVISGFHDDYTGSILIDGKELRNIDKDDWRYLLGYVTQETFVFNDTIRYNLTFGFKREISEEEIIIASKNAQIYDTVMSFKDKFDTELGERGVRLSGGEKQRLAIARIFLKNPSVVFLDEATSHLDSESEKKVKEALDALGKNRTVVSVAHRLSTIADFDQIYVLEKGRIVESGNHSELIDRKGLYYRYYIIQSMESNQVNHG